VGAFVAAIPESVIGGGAVVMFAMVTAVGGQTPHRAAFPARTTCSSPELPRPAANHLRQPAHDYRSTGVRAEPAVQPHRGQAGDACGRAGRRQDADRLARLVGSHGGSREARLVLLRTLVVHPGLDLRVLAGEDDLDRRIRWIYTTDLHDPSRYLSGGCLVLSGLLWWRGPEDSESFVATLAEAGVAALGAGTAEHGFVPDDLVDTCRRHGIVLLEVPEHVSFATITELVVLALAAEQDAAGGQWEPAGLPEALRRAGAALDAGCWLLSPTTRVIAGSGPVPSLAQRQLLVRRALTGSDAEGSSLHSRGCGYTVVPTGSGHPLAGWVLVVESEAARWTRAQRRAVDGLLATARAELSRLDDARRNHAAARTAMVRAVLSASPTPPDVIGRLRHAGLSERLCVATASTEEGGPALALAVLEELALHLGVPSVVAEVNGEAFGLLAVGRERLDWAVAELSEAVQVLEPGLRRAGLAVGISPATSWAAIRGAAEESRHARQLAEHRHRRASVVNGATLTAYQLLLAAVPRELRASYRERVLGPVAAYDAEHQSDLVHTLRVFLDCSGSWKRAAQRLHLHVNTLRYRIERIGELTGRDLTTLAAQVDMHIALHLD
jgi:hypothetical protein